MYTAVTGGYKQIPFAQPLVCLDKPHPTLDPSCDSDDEYLALPDLQDQPLE